MTHIQHQQDRDLHDENGGHISTPPSTSGHQLELWERRIRYHLACHEAGEDAHYFTCPRCGRTSYNPMDKQHGYCGACHDFTAEPQASVIPVVTLALALQRAVRVTPRLEHREWSAPRPKWDYGSR